MLRQPVGDRPCPRWAVRSDARVAHSPGAARAARYVSLGCVDHPGERPTTVGSPTVPRVPVVPTRDRGRGPTRGRIVRDGGVFRSFPRHSRNPASAASGGIYLPPLQRLIRLSHGPMPSRARYTIVWHNEPTPTAREPAPNRNSISLSGSPHRRREVASSRSGRPCSVAVADSPTRLRPSLSTPFRRLFSPGRELQDGVCVEPPPAT
jgi:hypothetical protein